MWLTMSATFVSTFGCEHSDWRLNHCYCDFVFILLQRQCTRIHHGDLAFRSIPSFKSSRSQYICVHLNIRPVIHVAFKRHPLGCEASRQLEICAIFLPGTGQSTCPIQAFDLFRIATDPSLSTSDSSSPTTLRTLCLLAANESRYVLLFELACAYYAMPNARIASLAKVNTTV